MGNFGADRGESRLLMCFEEKKEDKLERDRGRIQTNESERASNLSIRLGIGFTESIELSI